MKITSKTINSDINGNKGKEMIIAIDPDNNESGMGIVYTETKTISSCKLPFPKLIEYLRETIRMKPRGYFKVIIEGGWLNESNWHVKQASRYARDKEARAAKIGRSTGMNAQTGILIQEYCDYLGIDCSVVKPLKKCWRGQEGKISQEEMKAFIPNLPRMNQDQRDALLLAWVYAGLPIKVNAMVGKK